MKLADPHPRSLTTWTVLVGRDCHGNWVARERDGVFGGLFVNRAQALSAQPGGSKPSLAANSGIPLSPALLL